jgi:hypothetical protein
MCLCHNISLSYRILEHVYQQDQLQLQHQEKSTILGTLNKLSTKESQQRQNQFDKINYSQTRL